LPAITDEERRNAALKLLEIGSKQGFSYVIEKMRGSELSPTDSPERYSIAKQDTDFVLEAIVPVRGLILKERSAGSRSWNDPRQTLLEWIAQLASKSEKDLKKVLDFYEQAKQDFALHPNVSDFNWYSERCKEKFKETGDYATDINFVNSLFEMARPKLAK